MEENRAMRRISSRWARLAPVSALALLALVPAALAAVGPAASGGTRPAAAAARHFPCSAPGAAHRPCYFSTPSGNIHCLWTPRSKAIECELRATRLAYRLRPTGRAQRVHVDLPRRGETLPAGPNTLVFPEALSCHSSRRKMTCNQDFGTGLFVLAPHGSHRA
jgi:hypothetical protein